MSINSNMGRPHKPAALQTGNTISKEKREQLIDAENELKGNNNRVKNIPEHLDKLGKEFYQIIIDELEVSNLLSNLDIPLVEQTADCLSKIRQCDDILNADGLMIYEPKGNVEVMKEHPMVSTKMKYLDRFRNLSTQLGMSPSSRSQLANLKIEQAEAEGDKLMEILRG